jgi:hypothetical protein
MVSADEAEQALGAFLRRLRLTLPENWQMQVLEILEHKAGDAQRAEGERSRLRGQLERLKKLFVFGDITDLEYKAERDQLQTKLAALKPLRLPDLEEAGRLLEDFGVIWDAATERERKQILQTLLNVVYLDSGERGPVVAIEPKSEFSPLFNLGQISREGTDPVGSICGISILPPGADAPGALEVVGKTYYDKWGSDFFAKGVPMQREFRTDVSNRT